MQTEQLENQPADIRVVRYSKILYKYAIRNKWGANVLCLKHDGKLLLVDTGYRSTSATLKEQLLKDFDATVSTIINTHHHADHSGGNNILDDNGTVYAHLNAKKHLAGIHVLKTVIKPIQLDLGFETIEITPREGGHSYSDCTVWFKKNNIIHLGDIYLANSFPLVGDKLHNDTLSLLYILKDIHKEIDDNTLIVSGHGPDTSKKDLYEYCCMIEDCYNQVLRKIKEGIKLKEIKYSNILQEYEKYNGTIFFITKHTFINDIYWSFYKNNY